MTVKRSAKVIKVQPPLRCAEPLPANMELEEDDIAWATRSGMWRARVEEAAARRTKRAKPPPALILAGHGVSLRIENGALTIRNGFTCHPQKQEIIRFFRGDVALPERIILLDGSGSISFELIGKATSSVSPAHRVIQPILFVCVGNSKSAKILGREMIFAAR
jgi:hypothetical protein